MTRDNRRLRVAFLSGVRHAIPYAQLLAEDPAVDLVGIAEEPTAPGWMRSDSATAAKAVGIPFFAELAPMLDPGAVDLVVICSEPTRHARLAIAGLDSAVHVLVDKPVATSVAEVDAIIAAADRGTTTIGVVNRLESPAVERLRRWVDAGHLGLPLHVDVEWFASGAHFSTSVERPELVVTPALSGGGEVLNFLLYPLDYIRYLTGLEVVEIHCETATLFNEAHVASGVEDCAVASLLLENGVTATVTLGRIPAAPGLGPVSSTIRLIGSHGNASSDDDRPQVSRYDTTGGISALPVGGPSSVAILRRFLANHVATLLHGERPTYSLTDARAGLSVIEAAYASSASGQPASLGRRHPTTASTKESL